METLIIIIIANMFSLAGTLVGLFVGAKVGQKVARGEKIEAPNLNPMKAIREHQDKKEAEREQERLNTILQNIDSYDGTPHGQKDVSRG